MYLVSVELTKSPVVGASVGIVVAVSSSPVLVVSFSVSVAPVLEALLSFPVETVEAVSSLPVVAVLSSPVVTGVDSMLWLTVVAV